MHGCPCNPEKGNEEVIYGRKSGINTVQYGGPEIAAKQREAYPDIVPLELPLPPVQVFKQATNIARSLGAGSLLM